MRNRNISGLVFMSFVLALALAVCSANAQNSAPATGSSAQTPQATSPEPPQTEPSQQNPATPAPESQPSSPGTPMSSGQGTAQSQSPSSSTSQTAPPAGTQSSNQPKSIDEELQLTPDQKQKIAAVVDDENKQISAVRDDSSMSMEQKQQKVLAIRQAGTPKIKAILTPDQLQRLAAIQQRMREQNGQGASTPSQQQANPPSSPQGTQPPQH
jgi:periplasmic protein CpxP/Spy